MQQLLLAATKSDAEAAYNKENKEPKQSAKPPHKRPKKQKLYPINHLKKRNREKKLKRGSRHQRKRKAKLKKNEN